MTAKPGRSKSRLPKLIAQYYAELAELAHQNVMYEMGTRTAFHAMPQAERKRCGWTLICESQKKVNGRRSTPAAC